MINKLFIIQCEYCFILSEEESEHRENQDENFNNISNQNENSTGMFNCFLNCTYCKCCVIFLEKVSENGENQDENITVDVNKSICTTTSNWAKYTPSKLKKGANKKLRVCQTNISQEYLQSKMEYYKLKIENLVKEREEAAEYHKLRMEQLNFDLELKMKEL